MGDSVLYTVEREGWKRPLLPCEEPNNGFYIHPDVSIIGVADRMGGMERTDIYVAAQAFMEMQKERDEYRRVLSLVNADLTVRRDDEAGIRRLRMAGFSARDAVAIEGILDEVRGGNRGEEGGDGDDGVDAADVD